MIKQRKPTKQLIKLLSGINQVEAFRLVCEVLLVEDDVVTLKRGGSGKVDIIRYHARQKNGEYYIEVTE